LLVLEILHFLVLFQGSSAESIKKISYAIKEINTVAGLHTYSVVGICDPEMFPQVLETWKNIFTDVDVLFFADENIITKTGIKHTNNVKPKCITINNKIIIVVLYEYYNCILQHLFFLQHLCLLQFMQ